MGAALGLGRWRNRVGVIFGVNRRVNRAFGVSGGKPLMLPFKLLVAELVAYTPNCQHHLGVLRIIFDLGTQPIDV